MKHTSHADVLIYHSPACPHCRQLISYLDANGISYDKVDVSGSPKARFTLMKLTGELAIPVTVVGDEHVSGFDRQRLRELLQIEAETEKTDAPGKATPHPALTDDELDTAVGKARELLKANCVAGRTRASQHLYPHQWNWDAGFVSRGYLHFDPEQAYREERLLFEAQWSDGFLPHIVFNPEHLQHFPGPDYWKADRSGRVPAGVHTSGISQPPVHASMLAAAPDLDPDRDRAVAFLRKICPAIRNLHDFLLRERDPEGDGLACLVHPWESGIDNAPIWDEPLAAVTDSSPWAKEMQARYDELAEKGNRPTRSYIEKYSFLIENLFTRDYNWQRIGEEHPFLVQDVLFNSVLCRAERDLAAIAEAVGEDPEPHRDRAEAIAHAVNRKLWHEEDGLYYSYDVRAGRPIKRDTIFSYLPLYAGICDEERGQRLINNLLTHCFCMADRDCVGIPSYDMCQADYDGEFYWRGPVWYNMCWYMTDGLRRYGREALAQWLEESLTALVVRHGSYEYYEPETGEGLGADGFSWTAALFLDLASRRG